MAWAPSRYQWQRDGVDIGGATGATYILTEAEVGKVITVVASYTDGQGTAEQCQRCRAAGRQRQRCAHRQRHDQRHTDQDQTLTASNTLADADGLGTISYQWQAAMAWTSAGLPAPRYVLTEADVGKLITVVASYTDGQGTAESGEPAADDAPSPTSTMRPPAASRSAAPRPRTRP